MTTRIHDYRRRYWGHDYTLTPDPDPVTASIIGWGLGIQVGDLLIIPRPEDASKAALYQVETLEWCDGVDDMWSTRCRFIPASSGLGERVLEAMTGPLVRSLTDALGGWWEITEGGDPS